MRFKNIDTKKENVEYVPGEVLVMYHKVFCKEEVYMVICSLDNYNIINLDSGVAYYNEYDRYDRFAEKLEKSFILIEIINNDELELVRVEG